MKLLKKTKCFARLLLCTSIISLCTVTTFALSIPKAESCANDFAGILSEETKVHIQKTSDALYKKCKVPVVVATIKSLEGEDISNYAIEMARKWQIAQKDSKKGILILLAVEDREIRIEVSDGLEEVLNDAKAGRIIRKFGTPLKENDYNLGITQIFDAVVAEVEEPGSVVKAEDAFSKEDLITAFFVILILVISFVVTSKTRRNRFWGSSYNTGGSWGGFGSGSSGGGSSSFGSGGSFGGGSSFSGGGASSKF